jgi:hypothetical protein
MSGSGQASGSNQRAENADQDQHLLTLRSMFPNIDMVVLQLVLLNHNYDQARAVETLLAATGQLRAICLFSK